MKFLVSYKANVPGTNPEIAKELLEDSNFPYSYSDLSIKYLEEEKQFFEDGSSPDDYVIYFKKEEYSDCTTPLEKAEVAGKAIDLVIEHDGFFSEADRIAHQEE